MDLKVSYNWLKTYVGTKLAPADLARELALHGPSVERTNVITPAFDQVIVGEIIAIEPHPSADRLQVTKVNIGKKENLTIVCGAPNIAVGQKVPVVMIGGRVGETEIKATAIRGVDSQGMLCSAKELGLSDDHAGIFVLPSYSAVGTPLEKIMPISDTIFEVEVTGNRTDLMGMVGLAREAAAITGDKYLYKPATPRIKIKEKKNFSVSIADKTACRRYQGIVLTGVKVESSPLWLQARLINAGLRPINNVVDITNYILLEFGQPMHVFDYDKLSGNKIIVRPATKGETLLALDGKSYALDESMLVIADAKSPVAIAGIMGGELTSATEATTTIALECANFDPLTIRRTARALNLHSDSSQLFEKNIHPANIDEAMARAIELVMEITGASVASEIIDQGQRKEAEATIILHPERVAHLIGQEISTAQITIYLTSLGFTVAKKGKTLSVKVPWYRAYDVILEHDLIEEVARLAGYHNIIGQLPNNTIPAPSEQRTIFYWENVIRDTLAAAGLTETYSYSLISEKMITNAGLAPTDHLPVANPLSIDFAYLRRSLAPSLLAIVADNQHYVDQVRIFELANIYPPRPNDLPAEQSRLMLAVTDRDGEIAFRQARGIIDALFARLHLTNITVTPATDAESWWQSGGVATITIGNDTVGTIGLVSKKTNANFGIDQMVAMVDLDTSILIKNATVDPTYQPIPRFPAITLDLSIIVDEAISYDAIRNTAAAVDPLIESVDFVSLYRGKPIKEGRKNITLRVTYRHNERTLELTEAQTIHDQIAKQLQKEYNVDISQ